MFWLLSRPEVAASPLYLLSNTRFVSLSAIYHVTINRLATTDLSQGHRRWGRKKIRRLIIYIRSPCSTHASQSIKTHLYRQRRCREQTHRRKRCQVARLIKSSWHTSAQTLCYWWPVSPKRDTNAWIISLSKFSSTFGQFPDASLTN